MNSFMYTHPFTAQHLTVLERQLSIRVVQPVVKTLVCGDTGIGAMAHVDDIVQAVHTACEPSSVQSMSATIEP